MIIGKTGIHDIATLFNRASDLHARTLRMQAKENGETLLNPSVLADLARAAEKLNVISRFNYSAQGVVFLQKEREIMAGAWPLKHIEAQSAAGYIAHRARKAAISQGYFL